MVGTQKRAMEMYEHIFQDFKNILLAKAGQMTESKAIAIVVVVVKVA